MASVAIVILNYNGKNYLEQFLPVTKKYSKPHTIHVVDNKSIDDSVAYLTESHPDIKLLLFSENYGYSGGYKKALEQIVADYYILLNSDIEVTENWIDPILTIMERDSAIAACQPKVLSFNNKDMFEYAGAAGGFIDRLGYPFCRGRIFESTEKDYGQYDDSGEVFWATGACLFLRSNAYHKAGGLDEDYFAHMEEIDLCWRFKKMGFKNFYCSESKIYHIGGGTLHKTNPHKTYLNFKNSLITLYKNSSLRQLFWKMPLRLGLDVMAAIRYLTLSSRGNFQAVIKAQYSFWRHISKHEIKRKKVVDLSKVNKLSAMFPGSIVVAYFFKNDRKFSRLKF